MSAILLALAALASEPRVSAAPSSPIIVDAKDYSDFVTKALAREAVEARADAYSQARLEATGELCRLFDETLHRADLAESEQRRLLVALAVRLAHSKTDLDRRLAWLARQAKSPVAANQARPASAAGGGAVADHGKELVELIQKTIAPDTWDVNGGNGVIVYYAPLKVLVVSQTDDVHGFVGGLMGALRK
jgi:hypothetical protein